jgi:Short C-terminal domain
MFGNKKKLVQELTEAGGTVAWATVLEASIQWRSSSSSSSFMANASMTDHVKVTVRVEPTGQPPFEVSFRQAFPGLTPMTGWQCKVIYDPDDHDRIAVLEDQIAPPGVDHKRAERGAELRQGMKAAMDSGNMGEWIQQVRDQAAGGALPGNVPAQASTAPAADATQANVIDELSKLADLHERGVLTDAEFAGQKAKLLGEG